MPVRIFFWGGGARGGLVRITIRLVDCSYSLPKWEAQKLEFSWYLSETYMVHKLCSVICCCCFYVGHSPHEAGNNLQGSGGRVLSEMHRDDKERVVSF